MHIDCRRCGHRPKCVRFVWFYKWGFGVWLGTFLFGFGHDTRPRIVTTDPEHAKLAFPFEGEK
jgi:hypothetical protein